MGSFKFFTFIVIGAYIIAQLYSIAVQSTGTRTITVYKRNYSDSSAYIKGYTVEGAKMEVFDVKVKPASVWDWLLLTQDDENVLVDLFKIAAALVFARYIFEVDYDTLFSKRNFNLFWFGLFLCVMAHAGTIMGSHHTSDFYRDLYTAKGGAEFKYDFQPRLRFDDVSVHLLLRLSTTILPRSKAV